MEKTRPSAHHLNATTLARVASDDGYPPTRYAIFVDSDPCWWHPQIIGKSLMSHNLFGMLTVHRASSSLPSSRVLPALSPLDMSS